MNNRLLLNAKKTIVSFVFVEFFIGFIASAQTTRRVVNSKKVSKLEEIGTSLIFSADVGLLRAVPRQSMQDFGVKQGLALEGKALGSILLYNFLVDSGFGWFFYNISGVEPKVIDGQRALDENQQPEKYEASIKLSGGLFEFSPSYRLSSSFFTGPTLQLRYSSDRNYDSQASRRTVGVYLGAQVGYQLFDSDLNTRLVARYMQPMNYDNWTGQFAMVGVQLGLPFTQPDSLTVHESILKTKEKKTLEYKKQVFKFKVTRDLIKLALDNLVVFYPDPELPTLTPESQSFLIDLSQSLSSTENTWSALRIDTISKAHAQAVRDALVATGVTNTKVKLGQPVAGDMNSANPPVELAFKGVKNQAVLMDAVRQAMKAMSISETCGESFCQ